jgi:hypothetical protein
MIDTIFCAKLLILSIRVNFQGRPPVVAPSPQSLGLGCNRNARSYNDASKPLALAHDSLYIYILACILCIDIIQISPHWQADSEANKMLLLMFYEPNDESYENGSGNT